MVEDWQRDTRGWQAHPRARDARAYGIRSSLFLPVFDPGHHEQQAPFAVLEASLDTESSLAISDVARDLFFRVRVGPVPELIFCKHMDRHGRAARSCTWRC